MDRLTSAGVRLDLGQLGTLTRLGGGGQGVVYSTPLKLRHMALPLVFKEYKPTVVGGLDVASLEAMPTYLESLSFARGLELLSLSAWPCRLVEDGGSVKGFLMPAIPPEFFLDMKKASGVSRQLGEFQHLLNGDSFLARRQIMLTNRHRYQLLAEVAQSLAVLHRHDIAVGDLSPKNLLFSIAPAHKVYFIDCDAMRFQGRSVVPQLETPGWEVRVANAGEELATAASDAYKLGLLALRLFVGDQGVRDVSRTPSHVPRQTRELIAAALDRRPGSRPAPADWVPVLTAAAAAASTKPPRLPAATSLQPRTPQPPPPRPPVPRPVGAPRPQGGRLPASSTTTSTTWPSVAPPRRSWWSRRSGAAKFAIVAVPWVASGVASYLLFGGSGSDPAEATGPDPVTFDFVGTWSGPVDQPDASEYSMVLTLTGTAEAGYSGTVEYPELECGGTASFGELTADGLVLHEAIEYGDCVPTGDMTLVPRDDGSIDWSYESGSTAHITRTTATDSPAGEAAPPFDFAGTWSGQVDQPGYGTYSIVLTLSGSAQAGYSGTVEYPELACGGTVSFGELTSGGVLLHEAIEYGDCVATGDMTLVPRDDGSIDWSYETPGYETATAHITRSTS